MKALTDKQLLEAPDEIHYLYIMQLAGRTVSLKKYGKAKNKYPQYFNNENL